MARTNSLKLLLPGVLLCVNLAAWGQNQNSVTQSPANGAGGQPKPERPSGRLRFSEQPSELEVFNARVFDEPLVPLGGTPRPEETKALAEALLSYASRPNLNDLSSLTSFLQAFPDSK